MLYSTQIDCDKCAKAACNTAAGMGSAMAAAIHARGLAAVLY